jgi:hypothetical protein
MKEKNGKISCESPNKTIITKELWAIYSIPTRTRYHSSVFYNGVFLFFGGWGFGFCFAPFPSFVLLFRICNGFSRRFKICNFL